MISERAELAFGPDATRILPSAIRLIERHADMAPATLSPENIDLTRITVLGARLTLRIETITRAQTPVLRLQVLSKSSEPTDEQIDRFLTVLYDLAVALPVREVLLPGLEIAISRDAFFVALSKIDRQRQEERGHDPRLTRGRRKSALQHGQTAANDAPQSGPRHYDEHVHAYHAHLRCRMLDETADDAPVAVGGTASGSTTVRLSAWAASLTAAAIYLPIALPVVIHNLKRGEDLRVASLAVALAGLYSMLDATGMMAASLGV